MRKVDIAHSGQTVPEAMKQLTSELESAQRGGDRVLLVVHGFGASGVGGAIKEAVSAELPRLAKSYGFKTFGHGERDRIPEQVNVDPRNINAGATLIVFPEIGLDKDSPQDFRQNFRNLRSKVRVPGRAPGSSVFQECRHPKKKLVSRGSDGTTYRCRSCGKTFFEPI